MIGIIPLSQSCGNSTENQPATPQPSAPTTDKFIEKFELKTPQRSEEEENSDRDLPAEQQLFAIYNNQTEIPVPLPQLTRDNEAIRLPIDEVKDEISILRQDFSNFKNSGVDFIPIEATNLANGESANFNLNTEPKQRTIYIFPDFSKKDRNNPDLQLSVSLFFVENYEKLPANWAITGNFYFLARKTLFQLDTNASKKIKFYINGNPVDNFTEVPFYRNQFYQFILKKETKKNSYSLFLISLNQVPTGNNFS